MHPSTITSTTWETPRWPIILQDIPILYEDEEEGDMGEANLHVLADEILHICLRAHVKAPRPDLQVFSNMNCYYLPGPPHPQTGSLPYVSPDNMIVQPFQPLPETVTSYTIGRDGPPPRAVGEVLSKRSAQQRDLAEKLEVYSKLGVEEYLLVDLSGKFLPEKLLLKRLQKDRSWKNEKDPDGGITSQLGFRVTLDASGYLSVWDAVSGRRYIRPDETEIVEEARRQAEQRARQEEEARRHAEERLRTLEAELARLRDKQSDRGPSY